MNNEIEHYNALQTEESQMICNALMREIGLALPHAESKIWHGGPVWFIDGNPVVGYSQLKNAVQLLFWSGQTFDEVGLTPVGKHKAAEARYSNKDELNTDDLSRWLKKSNDIQWDYKNIVRRNGVLERLK